MFAGTVKTSLINLAEIRSGPDLRACLVHDGVLFPHKVHLNYNYNTSN
jgi:hypothetical protein